MANELIKKTIDGHDYEFSIFGAKKSIKVLVRLSKILGKPFGLLMGSFKGPGKMLEREVDTDLMSLAFSALTDNLDSDEVIDILETLVAGDYILCDGKKVIFDTHYEGRLDHLMKVVMIALEVQYGNFSGAISALRPVKKNHHTMKENQT